ncbi:hypothetical protein KTJ72_03025 [Apilactobacillus sp. HBW1]|uniref:GIY-YIG domain-containing protein n=1 Tax=Apilactobacillus waqarii TaxID=2851006 RepID=A0ABS6M3V6_9LACO|nr:GIY-YIG nuclease family protein [Apilactobacillus waqarii]MBV0914878.1 hypothetical protein [Apilactobacillus waqarii]
MCTDFYIYKIRLDPTPDEDGIVPDANPIYYIGETKNIKKRLTYHIHGSNNSSKVIIKHLHPDDNHPEYYVSSVEAIYRFSNYDFHAGDSFICNIENYFYSLEKNINGNESIWGAFNTQIENPIENNDFEGKIETARNNISNFYSNYLENINKTTDDNIFDDNVNEEDTINGFNSLFNQNVITVTRVLNEVLNIEQRYKNTTHHESIQGLSDFLDDNL